MARLLTGTKKGVGAKGCWCGLIAILLFESFPLLHCFSSSLNAQKKKKKKKKQNSPIFLTISLFFLHPKLIFFFFSFPNSGGWGTFGG